MEYKYENMLASSMKFGTFGISSERHRPRYDYGWGLVDTNCDRSPMPTDNGKSYTKSIAHGILPEENDLAEHKRDPAGSEPQISFVDPASVSAQL